MKMRRNCNLELRLLPSHDSGHNHHLHPILGEGNNNDVDKREDEDGQQQKLTIFYDGKVCVSDVTDLQARWIMKEASKEMADQEKIINRSLSHISESEMCGHNNNNSTNNNNNHNNNTSSLSMKRSLQSFLQKRKNRILHSSPYHP